MHGIVLLELKKHVELAYGPATWSALLLASGLPDRLHSPMADYDDAEAMAIVAAAGDATGTSTAEVLEAFGRFLAPNLVATYRFLVPATWDALDLVEHTEETIHTLVRARAGGNPPVLQVSRTGPDRLTVRYDSPRRLCALTRGMIRGVGDHYGTPLQVGESSCMHLGAPECTMTITRLRAAPPAPRTAGHDEVLRVVR